MCDFYNQDAKCVLELDDVCLSYGTNKRSGIEKAKLDVISHFNLEVHEGEFLVLVGPSGCGKTTLLSIMAGIIKPSSGLVKMSGAEVNDLNWKREIVFQSPTLYPWYDVFGNISYGPRVRGIDKEIIKGKVQNIVELVGLEDYLHAKVYELSGGMKQRVALARVLINEPDIILMDEPFGALDAFTRSKMQILVRDLWRKTNSTVVLITHDVDEALELASRIIVLGKEPCDIKGMFNAMFSTPLQGDYRDDALKETDEYVMLRRNILNLL